MITTNYIRAFISGLILSGLIINGWAATSNKEYIDNPALAKRCEKLLKDRNDKKAVCKKLNQMLAKNSTLLEQTPHTRKSIKKKLFFNRNNIERTLASKEKALFNLEKKIIKSGCPKIPFETEKL